MDKLLDYGSYAGFRDTVEALTSRLKVLREHCETFSLNNTAASITDTIDRVSNEHFEVAIVGEFKRGKSTLINALLGQEVLPSDVLPATATLNRVTYSKEPYVEIEYKDGRAETVDIDQLQNYVTKLTFESEMTAETVKEATVYYDTEFCRNNVDIIDTPGLNDDEQMTSVTLSILPEIDAAVFVISANSPFSQFEKEFLEKKMLTSDVGRVIFAVNCFGTFSKQDETRIVDTVRQRIARYVMEKAKKVMGEDSKEFAVYKRKIGTPKVVGIYAKQALIAKQEGDAQALQESNFPAFEEILESMLTKERGSITLQILANKIISSGTELLNAIVLRENALLMENDKFMVNYRAATAEIEEIRNKKRAEFVRINGAAMEVFESLQPLLDGYWDQIEEAAMQVIDEYSMAPEDLKRDRLKMVYTKLNDKIRQGIETRAQLICEQIQNEINIAISDEAEKLQGFEDEFFASVARIQEMFSVSEKDSTKSRTIDNIIGAATGSFGIGGLYVGFKDAGIKGALLGGATAFAGFYATFYASAFFAGVLGITGAVAGGPVTICLLAIAGLAGTFSSKALVDKILVKDRIDKFKSDFKIQVKKQFHEMKLSSDFTETVRQQVFGAYEGLKAKIESETEIILKDTQETLDNLNKMKAEKTMMSDSEKERLRSVAEETGNILADAYIMHRALTEAMEDGAPAGVPSEA